MAKNEANSSRESAVDGANVMKRNEQVQIVHLSDTFLQKISRIGEENKNLIRSIPFGIAALTFFVVGSRRYWFRRWTSLTQLPLSVLRGQLLLSCRLRSIESDGMLCVIHQPILPPILHIHKTSADAVLFVQLAAIQHTKASIDEMCRYLRPNQRLTVQVLQIRDKTMVECRLWSWWLWPLIWQPSLSTRLVRLGLANVNKSITPRANTYADLHLMHLLQTEAVTAKRSSQLWRRFIQTGIFLFKWLNHKLSRRSVK